jgi:hypothetical protein
MNMWIVILVVLAFIAGWYAGRIDLVFQRWAATHDTTMPQEIAKAWHASRERQT